MCGGVDNALINEESANIRLRCALLVRVYDEGLPMEYHIWLSLMGKPGHKCVYNMSLGYDV